MKGKEILALFGEGRGRKSGPEKKRDLGPSCVDRGFAAIGKGKDECVVCLADGRS